LAWYHIVVLKSHRKSSEQKVAYVSKDQDFIKCRNCCFHLPSFDTWHVVLSAPQDSKQLSSYHLVTDCKQLKFMMLKWPPVVFWCMKFC